MSRSVLGKPSQAYASFVDDGPLVAMTAEEIGLTNVRGDPRMLVHELRSTHGAHGDVWAAVVSVEPCTFDYTFAGDETLHVLEGAATVDVDESHAIELRPGSIASFTKGATSRWRIHEPFREFVVLTDA